MIGHVTVDLVTFPHPKEPTAEPLFWAVDINASLSDYAAITLFFDILMEGKLDPESGEYEIESLEEGTDAVSQKNRTGDLSNDDLAKMAQVQNRRKEPRNFIYCNYLHHPGLSAIQYKTFFHMCRLE